MYPKKIELAVREAEAFIERAKAALADQSGPKEGGALRRQSMELTRALADMRKP